MQVIFNGQTAEAPAGILDEATTEMRQMNQKSGGRGHQDEKYTNESEFNEQGYT
ncbi:MAG: hypothetical protein WC314_06365 [Vulcanimicrobiota bacterium]